MAPASKINFRSNEDTPLLAAGFFIGGAQAGALRGRTVAVTVIMRERGNNV
jgi:hypothetical protein